MREFNIAVMGTGAVGKSCLCIKFVQGIFMEQYDPTIEDQYRKIIEVDGAQVKLEILDTAGTDQLTSMRNLYMKEGDGFMLVYAVTAAGSLHELELMHEQIVRAKDNPNVPVMVVANKIDLVDQRLITTEEGKAFAAKIGAQYIETSAKTSDNVDNAYVELTRMIIAANPLVEQKPRRHCHIL